MILCFIGSTASSTAGGSSAAPNQQPSTSSSNIEINPEFLAALPPQIQEELLTQQRIEQQARAAAEAAAAAGQGGAAGATATTSGTVAATTAVATTGAAAEDDNAAFIRALPPSLRQTILFDMDHSQIAALPEDLATEARALQQQHREREIDLFSAAHRSGSRFGGGGGGGGNYLGRGYRISANRGLEGIYNVASSLLHDTYLYGGSSGRDFNRLRRNIRHLNEANGGGEIILGHGAIPSGFGSLLGGGGGGGPSGLGQGALAGAGAMTSGGMPLERVRTGRQLLDHESIACLLVLLFIDDPRMNMTKLHRLVRNLCIHSPTRAWIIKGNIFFSISISILFLFYI